MLESFVTPGAAQKHMSQVDRDQYLAAFAPA